MARENKKQQIQRIAKIAVEDLKKDKKTLAIFLKGSAVTGIVHSESDVDIIRVVNGPSRSVHWPEKIEGVKIEVTDISKKDWDKPKKLDFSELEAHLATLKETKVVWDPHNMLKKLKTAEYHDRLKLYNILNELSDAKYKIKGSRKSLALNNKTASYELLRSSIKHLAAVVFALNKYPKIPRFWHDEINKLKRVSNEFKQIHEKVLRCQLTNKEKDELINNLWEIYHDTEKFCKRDVRKIVREMHKEGKNPIKELKLNELQRDILKEMIA